MTPTQAEVDAARAWLGRFTIGDVPLKYVVGMDDSLAALLAQTREAAYAQGWTDGATAQRDHDYDHYSEARTGEWPLVQRQEAEK